MIRACICGNLASSRGLGGGVTPPGAFGEATDDVGGNFVGESSVVFKSISSGAAAGPKLERRVYRHCNRDQVYLLHENLDRPHSALLGRTFGDAQFNVDRI